MTDSESDTGFIQFRNRLLELLYSSNSALSVDQIVRILAVDELRVVNELKQMAHGDVVYDLKEGIVQVRVGRRQARPMEAEDVVIDAPIAEAPVTAAGTPSGVLAADYNRVSGSVGGTGEQHHKPDRGSPVGRTAAFGSPLDRLDLGYTKHSGIGYQPHRGMRTSAPKGALRKTKYRRVGDPETVSRSGGLGEGLASPTGRVGYVCVADEFRLSEMESYYSMQGYYTKFAFDVLHIRFSDKEMKPKESRSESSPLLGGADFPCSNALEGGKGNSADGEKVTDRSASSAHIKHLRNAGFDLFVFGYGAVVWWGFDQRFFKIVENDFMLPNSPISVYMINRYATQLVNGNYPVWCTFNLARKESLEPDEHFREQLRFDHFLIPCGRGDLSTGNVCMLCVSHALAQSAKIDYLELKVQGLAEKCSPLPLELREKGRVTITERKLLQLRGEVLSYRLMLKSGSNLMDEPDFFWENAYLKPVFQATKECFEVAERVEALDNKLDAANEILSMIAEEFSQRHGARLEWIVIWLVFVEVVLGVLELIINIKPWRDAVGQ